ncbi:NmrA/HSCARG family protein [Kineosporia rhizophila]|uniref:NmrA/HSCARG family protein n=1 Tax=Kineosporia rhizophila TaxID=84633 RepID=UPI001E5F621A|nr:NmrA/HSCARG family protein [Kineosporia rhizophila]
MTDKKIIAVVGATGAQGGGLARAVLEAPDGPFVLRAITRNPSSAKARALADAGAEVVAADLGDEASLRAAFEGAYGAFVVTNYWDPDVAPGQSRSKLELTQAANAARAAREAGLKHVVWSTLEDTRPYFRHLGTDVPVLEDGYTVPHFDAKAEANAYFNEQGVPTTFLETTFFYEAFTSGQGPQRGPDGRLVLALAMDEAALSAVAAEDIGRTAYGIFAAGQRYVGRTVGLAGTHATGAEIAGLLAKVIGEPVDYRPLTFDQLRAAGFPAAEELGNMFQFYAEASESFVAHRDLEHLRTLNPRLQSLEDWLLAHQEELRATL